MSTQHPRFPAHVVDDLPVEDGLEALLREIDGGQAVPDAGRRSSLRPRWVALAAAAAVVAAVSLPVLLDRGGSSPEPSGPSPASSGGPSASSSALPGNAPRAEGRADSVLVLPPADRGAPVELSGTTLDGDRLDVADLRGQVTVLATWRPSCETCLASIELVSRLRPLSEETRAVGLVTGGSRDAARRAADDVGDGFDSIPAPDDLGAALGHGLTTPGIVVLDRQGRVAVVADGALPSVRVLQSLVENVQRRTLAQVLRDLARDAD